MKEKDHHKKLHLTSEGCNQCGICLESCTLLSDLGSTPGEIARTITENQVGHETIAAVQRCDLCGLCGELCEAGMEPAEMMVAARTVLCAQGKMPVEDYEVALMDRDWNAFSLYRETYGIDYSDLKCDTYKTLFLPGCTLASFASELTRATHQWLLSQGMSVGFTELCCSEPLGNMGLKDRADQYNHYLLKLLREAGANSIVTACPGSFVYLTKSLPEIQVPSLYRLMKDAGVRVNVNECLTVHDSCPDSRPHGPKAGEDLREMLAGNDLVEMKHSRKRSICCGSGGVVSLVDSDLFLQRARRRVDEYKAVGARRLVTACMTCVYTLSHVSEPYAVAHFLELAFGISIDQTPIRKNLHAMWAGESGKTNQARLLQASSFTSHKG